MKVGEVYDKLLAGMILVGWAGAVASTAGLPVSTPWEEQWLLLLLMGSLLLCLMGFAGIPLVLVIPQDKRIPFTSKSDSDSK